MPRVYSSRQVGKLVGADPSSVNRWIDSGKLRAYRTPGGHRRVLYDDLVEFLEQCGMPLPDELLPERKSLLLVDDDALYLRSLRRSLTRADRSLQVEACTSGVEALILIGARKPDVVVLDVFMPGIDGIEVCEKIKSNPETQNTMVIAVTGRPSSGLEKKVTKAGASAFLAKPFKAAQLLELFQESARSRAR
jgi:excisionase family DNA binding protein